MSHGGVQKSEKNGNGAQAPESSRVSTDSPPPPPDGGWGWMVVFASFMIHIVSEYLVCLFSINKVSSSQLYSYVYETSDKIQNSALQSVILVIPILYSYVHVYRLFFVLNSIFLFV